MFYLITPDGFTITREATLYSNIEEAKSAFNTWKSKYETQGYYSSSKHGSIKLDKLWDYMILHPKPFYNDST